jgi:cytochrome c2
MTLTFLAIGLTIGLFGFTLWRADEISAEMEEQEPFLGCGTAGFYYNEDVRLDERASDGKRVFDANCKACHRLNQKLVGPALAGVYDRRDSLWITKMIVNGNRLLKRKDKIALELYKEYSPLEHMEFTYLKRNEIDALMHYLKTEPSVVY